MSLSLVLFSNPGFLKSTVQVPSCFSLSKLDYDSSLKPSIKLLLSE